MTPDLDALSALLATGHTPFPWRIEGDQINNSDLAVADTYFPEDAALIVAAVNALPSLIEAARREAGLREALAQLTIATDSRNTERVIVDRGQIRGEYGDSHDEAIERLRLAARKQERALATARALLHDNAGTGER